MSHFSTEEFVDLLDDALPPTRRAHLAACLACRTEAEGLSRVMVRAAESRDVPEPSPLFWDHVSARIREHVAGPVAKTWKDLVWWPQSAWAAGVAAMVLVLVASHGSPGGRARAGLTRTPYSAAASLGLATVSDPGDDVDRDQAWAVVRSGADDSAADAAQDAGITTRPDAAERMTLELSSREKSELVQLLEGELKRTGT
jgi:hypothetical protein